MNDDHDLLQEYVRNGTEEAFREIVSRYAGLVYSTALRHVHEASLAEEVAQNVFALLARKARSVPREASLAGWLHRSACHLARHVWRSETRRRARESAAVSMNEPDNSSGAAWDDVQAVLDESLGSLSGDDREAVLLNAEFQRYEDSIAERHKLNQFKVALGGKDPALALTADQEEKLMNMMHRERKALNLGTPLEQETKFEPARYTPENLAAQREKSAQLQEKILTESRAILQPEQQGIFAESLKNVRAMEDASLEIAQSLFARPAE